MLLNKVNLYFLRELTDKDLFGLLNIEKLSEFSCEYCFKITFERGIVLLLKVFGHSLTSLSLVELSLSRYRKAPSINIRTIVQYCPQLEILELGDNGDFVVAPLEEERQIRDFRYLKKLHICCRSEYFFVSKYESGYDISREALDMLLTSPVLESLILEYCRPFDDDMILKVGDKFCNLEKLEFFGSHAVTRQGIELLMNENNCLKKIRIFDCDLVTEEDAKKLEKFVKDKKWDVEWNWKAIELEQ